MAGNQGVYPCSIRSVIVPIGPSIAYVPLTKGQFALIDSDNAALFGQWNWYAQSCRNGFYARRMERTILKTRRLVIMHRLVVNLADDMEVDHKNGLTLDNRRTNLREATRSQNCRNCRTRSNSKSGYKGVSWNTRDKSFVCHIRHQGKAIELWRGQDPVVGHAIYCEAAIRLHGEFARTA